MKLMLLLIVAVSIDAMQALLAMGFAGFGLIPVAGVVVGPLGIVIGFAISTCLSLTFGLLVVFLLVYYDMFYPGITAWAFVGESVPGFSMLPSWTALVVASYSQKLKAEKMEGASEYAALTGTTAALATDPRVQWMRAQQNKTNLTAVRAGSQRMIGNETAQQHNQERSTSRIPILPDKKYASVA